MDDKTLQSLVSAVAKEELGEDEETRSQIVQQMRAWVEKNPDISNCRTDDSFFLRFLRFKKFSLTLAQQTVIKFLESLKNAPDITTNLDALDPPIDALTTIGHLYTSPYRDERGRQVTINPIACVDTNGLRYQDLARLILINLLTMIEDETSQVVGHVYMIDCTDVTVAHATFWPILEATRLLLNFQSAVPMRHKEVHILNPHPLMKIFFELLLRVVSAKYTNRFLMHSSLEELQAKVSPTVLPKEYGGTMPAKEMVDLWRQTLISKRDTVMSLRNISYNPRSENIEMGTFRKLNID